MLTRDQVFETPDTGPGLIRIYDTATPANLWQIIPVGRNDFPYIGSILAEVSASAVGDVAPTLTIRQVDDAVDDGTKKWKDPEGYTDGTTSWVYMTAWFGTPRDEPDTARCVTGI